MSLSQVCAAESHGKCMMQRCTCPCHNASRFPGVHANVPAVYDVTINSEETSLPTRTKREAVFLWPHHGPEDVRLRLWPMNGDPFDVFVNAVELREALDHVAPVRSTR